MVKINIQKASLKSVKDHTIIVPVYQQDSKPVLPNGANHLKPLLEKLKKEKSLDGAFKQLAHLRYVKVGKCENVLFVGIGEKKTFKLTKLREAFMAAAAHLSRHKVPSFSLHLSSLELSETCDFERFFQIVTESLVMPLYQFIKFKKEAVENSGVKSITMVVNSTAEVNAAKKGIQRSKIFIEACDLVRDLVNMPSNELRTDTYAKLVEEIGKREGLKVKVFKKEELEKEGFNALLAVNKGSDQPPRLVILEHQADKKGLDTICLVGKGITFDSGGISLKPSTSMETMKMDMAGSANVLGIMQIAARLNLPLHIVGVMAITDNMPSGKATVPGDIVKAYSGKTIEILNTDAEGRLILADALAYADKHYKPKLMIDFATLTGACIIALGEAGAGVMATDEANEFMERLKTISSLTGEKIWQLPLWGEFREEFVSDNADIRNIGTTKGAGASKAAIFLKEFVGKKTPWIHFDIAGPAYISKPTHRYYPKGATAAGVRLVAEFLANWNQK